MFFFFFFFLLIVASIVGFCNSSMFCCALLCAHSSFVIILMGKRELVVLLVSRNCCVALPHNDTGLSAVCDCGISWSYSLAIFDCLYFGPCVVVFCRHFSDLNHTNIYFKGVFCVHVSLYRFY